METLSLFELDTESEKKFKEFHHKNPQVYNELVRLANQAKESGRRKVGLRLLLEVTRWNRLIKTTEKDFKINNNYAPFYARMIMEKEPQLIDFFETRRVRS